MYRILYRCLLIIFFLCCLEIKWINKYIALTVISNKFEWMVIMSLAFKHTYNLIIPECKLLIYVHIYIHWLKLHLGWVYCKHPLDTFSAWSPCRRDIYSVKSQSYVKSTSQLLLQITALSNPLGNEVRRIPAHKLMPDAPNVMLHLIIKH